MQHTYTKSFGAQVILFGRPHSLTLAQRGEKYDRT